MEWQIGDFSIITRLTVKTIRFYHEANILLPSRIDSQTGYRFYNKSSVERARAIATLRDFDCSIEEIQDILTRCQDDKDLFPVLEKKVREMQGAIRNLQDKERRLIGLLNYTKEQDMHNEIMETGIKMCAEELVATISYRGTYADCGKYLAKLFQAAGPNVGGKAFSLYTTNEYTEGEGDLIVGIPVRKMISAPGIVCHVLAGGQVAFTIHKGPYETLGTSYERLLNFAKSKGLATTVPIREIYQKGPGMIFRGNPARYLTEIRLPITSL